MSDMNSYLASLDSDYAAASDASHLPDGRYTMICKSAELKENKNKPGFRLAWDLIVMDGPQKGRHEWKSNAITKESLEFLKGDLKKAGIQMVRLSELADLLPSFVGRMLETAVLTKAGSDFPNVYINRFLGMGDLSQFSKGAIPASSDSFTPIDGDVDDLPFD